jgi:large subunit ribosomal protein L25
MKFEMTAEVRDRSGKGAARQLRRSGRVPGVLYGQGECVLLTLDPDVVRKTLRTLAGGTGLISLQLAGGKGKSARTALLRDYQVDPVSGELLHVDLFEVSMTKPIKVKVPVVLTGGQPAGVKEGGILHHNMREVHVECLPSAIPDSIEVDASGLNIAQGIHIKELAKREGIRFLDDPDNMVVSVAAPMSEAKLEALLTSGAVTEEGKEPEVIAKGKVETEEGAAAAAAGAAPAAGEKPGAEKKPAAGEQKAGAAAAAPKAEKKEEKKK